MTNKSKIKGGIYEAKIAKLLTKELGKEFRRVPLSGSIDFMKGDVFVPSDTAWFPYVIECKHYKELNFTNLLTAKSNELYSFWAQVQEEAKTMDKLPLVIFRWNRSKDYVLFDSDLEVKDFIHVNCFCKSFKIALLSDWVEKFKERDK